MQLKNVLLSVVSLAICGSAIAQDKIYKRDGDVIDAKIKSVGTKTITYSKFDNQSGPEYTVVKADVTKIKYQNGSEDVFGKDWPRGPRRDRSSSSESGEEGTGKPVYGRNIVALAPLQFTENGLGFSFSYERSLDRSGIVSFYMPLVATFNLNNGSYYNNTNGLMENGHQDAMFYAMPGVKLYPTGANGHVRYAVGPSVVIGVGDKSNSNYDYNTGAMTYNTYSHNVLGMLINNSLNINPNQHIYLGLELGLGFSYLNRVNGINQGTDFLAQGGFKIGYRF